MPVEDYEVRRKAYICAIWDRYKDWLHSRYDTAKEALKANEACVQQRRV